MIRLSISKHVFFPAAMLLVLFGSPGAHGQTPPRYEAVFFDGTRVDGEKVSGWGVGSETPRLDSTVLFDTKRPLRWFRDRRVKPWRMGDYCPGYIEFVGGDRIVGHIAGVQAGCEIDGLYVPAHILIRPAASPVRRHRKRTRHVRILTDRIQRIVFGSASRRSLQPGSLFYRNGRRVGFVRLRWMNDSVVLLLKDGTSEVKLSQIAEVHPPRIDPWRAYYRELAVLSPNLRSRMVRIETTSGLIATASDLRLAAMPFVSLSYKMNAMKQLANLDKLILSNQDLIKTRTRELDEASAKFAKESARLIEQLEAATKAYEIAKGKMQRSIEELRKNEPAELTKLREQFARELQSAERETREWLTKAPDEKHDEILATSRARQDQLLQTQARALQAARIKSEQKKQRDIEQKQKALDRFTKQETSKLKKLQADQQRYDTQQRGALRKAASHLKDHWRALRQRKSRREILSGPGGTARTWYHIIQPVWSLDPLRLPFGSICMRWSFAPEQIPLPRVPPVSTVSPPLLRRYTNRSSPERPLCSGGDEYAWGFAVHAYSELRFPLPGFANAFHSRIGLDHIVGSGGCARARVYVGSTSDKPVYESPLLVGSKKTADTGRIALTLPSEGPRRLILQADPANRDSPPGADPLNIRDKLDWLDPWLEMDVAQLQDRVRRHIGPLIGGARGWTVRLDRKGVYTWTSHLDETGGPGASRFLTMLQAEGRPLKISREMTIGPEDKWLAVHVSLPVGMPPRTDSVALRVGGRQIRPRKVPIRQEWQDWSAPLLFPIAEYQGRKVTLELTQPAGGKPLYWQAVSTLATTPPAYRLLDIMESAVKGDMQVPYELGSALQSNRIARGEKFAALAITRFGGIVNFRPCSTANVELNGLTNVMLGGNWTGGDEAFIKSFSTFKKMPSLKTLVVTHKSGVSSEAMARLQAEMPKLAISRIIKRIPSHKIGGRADVTWRNLTDKRVVILYVGQDCKLNYSRYLNPGQVIRVTSNGGSRLEAHYHRKDFTSPQHYAFSLPLTTSNSRPGLVWDIRPVEKQWLRQDKDQATTAPK